MADNSADNSENQQMNAQLQDMKPCFEVSNSKIFVNLHIAASQKAAKKVNFNPKDQTINQFIINTGMSNDGRYITQKLAGKDIDDVGDSEDTTVKGLFGMNGNKYEMGIVLQFTEFKAPTHQEIKDHHDDIWEAIWDVNEDAEKKFRNLIYDGIEEYFHWFADTNIGNPDVLTPFIPDYDGGKVKLAGGTILGLNKEEAIKYLTNRVDKEEDDDPAGKHFVPRFGYKVGYSIKY